MLRLISGLFRFLFSRAFLLLVLATLALWAFWRWGADIEVLDSRPFAAPWTRLAVPFVLAALVAVLSRRRQLVTLAARLALRLTGDAGFTGAALDSTAIDDRLELMERMEAASAAMPKGGGDAGYGLPWYLLAGPPSSGKGSLVAACGLELPELQPAAERDQPTGTCNIWISARAVVVEAAGRLATQPNDQADPAAWRTLLRLLAHERPRRPINAMVLAVPVGELIGAPAPRLNELAVQLRRRAMEAAYQFDSRLPLYLVVTKCDLLAGFAETVQGLPLEERQRPWGFALPAGRSRGAGPTMPLVRQLLGELCSRVETRLPGVLHQSRDPAQRVLITGFAGRLRRLVSGLDNFLDSFLRSDPADPTPLLRGVFLTSAGTNAFDPASLIAAVDPPFELAPERVPAPPYPQRSTFSLRLFEDALLPEAELVGQNRRIERRVAAGKIGLLLAAAACCAAVFWLWGGVFDRRLQMLDEARTTADQVERLSSLMGTDETPVMVALASLQALRRDQPRLPSWLTGLGLGIDSRLQPAVGRVYADLLRTRYQAILARRAARQLTLTLASNAPAASVRDALKIYLMLHMPERANRGELRDWLGRQQSASLGGMGNLADYFGDLMDAGLNPRLVPIAALVDQARRALLQVSPANEVYDQLKLLAVSRNIPDIRLGNLLQDDRLQQVAQDPFARSVVVPGFYTAEGFNSVFIRSLPLMVVRPTSDDWVMGEEMNGALATTADQLIRQVTAFYVADYINAWRSFLSGLRFIRIQSIGDASLALDVATGPDSPIRTMLDVLKRNTDLPPPDMPPAAGQAASNGLAGKVLGNLAQLAGVPVGQANPLQDLTARLAGPGWPGNAIGQAFLPLRRLTDTSQGGGSGLEAALAALSGVNAYVKGVASAGDIGTAAIKAAIERQTAGPRDPFAVARMVAGQQPEPLRQWILQLTDDSWSAIVKESAAATQNAWQQNVIPEWQRSFASRYPFVRTASRDVALKDFAAFFGPNGLVDQFFRDRLAPFVNTSGSRWTAVLVDGVGLGLSEETLSTFHRLQQIRQAFFVDNGAGLATSFTFKPALLDGRILQLQLQVEGVSLLYRHDPPRAKKLKWPNPDVAGSASISVVDVDNQVVTTSFEGAWAMFRLFDYLHIRPVRSGVFYDLTLRTADRVDAAFELQADSSENPFDPSLLAGFQLPDKL